MSRLHRIVIWVLVLIGYLSVNFSSYGPSLIVYFIDVGQGDAILIISPDGRSMLIDGGPQQVVVGRIDELLSFWRRQIDVVMATHPDDDHISGLVSVLERYEVSRVLQSDIYKDSPANDKLQRLIGDLSIETGGFYRGQRFIFDELTVESLWPEEDRGDFISNINEQSQVVWIRYGDFEMLLTGDAESESLHRAVSDKMGPIEVLKTPHHGSKGGLDDNLLERLQPNVSIISSGEDNSYGHPSAEILQLLSDSGTQIYRTDQQGTIKVVVDGSGFSVYSQK